jgi:hypothetical protein
MILWYKAYISLFIVSKEKLYDMYNEIELGFMTI